MLFSSFFQHFYFWFVSGVKGQKYGPKWQKKSCCTSYHWNHILYDCHLRYTFVKWWYLQVFFIFTKFWFSGLLGGRSKRARNSSKWQKIISVALNISGTIHQMTVICGTQVWNANISRPFFLFFQNFDFWGQ